MYNVKSKEYFTNVRHDLIAALKNKNFNNVLELGAGGCDTLVYMKQEGLAKTVTGIDLMDIPGSNQQNNLIDKLIVGNLENENILNLPSNNYDLVICGDILEHLINPWETLKKVHSLVKENGIIISSVPNIREFQALIKIFFKGDFKYNEQGGILDKTHLRFFCKKNLEDLFSDAGFRIEQIAPAFLYSREKSERRVLNKITFGLFEGLLAFQYIIIASK